MINVVAVTDPGRMRERNEDACGSQLRKDATEPYPLDAMVVVADGVGGHDGGDVASRFVVDAVRDTVAAAGERIPDLSRWLEQLLNGVHSELLRMASEKGLDSAMGSTATIGAVTGHTLTIAHVGDSRCYRLRNGFLEQLTDDHSWVAEQLRAGLINAEEAERHERKNVLTQCLGIGQSLSVFVAREEMSEGDRFLLCSDGLHGPVTDDEIAATLNEVADPESAARVLIAKANAGGGPDNITAAILDFGARSGATVAPRTDEEDTREFPIPETDDRPGGSRTRATLRANGVLLSGIAVLAIGGSYGAWDALRPSSTTVASSNAVTPVAPSNGQPSASSGAAAAGSPADAEGDATGDTTDPLAGGVVGAVPDSGVVDSVADSLRVATGADSTGQESGAAAEVETSDADTVDEAISDTTIAIDTTTSGSDPRTGRSPTGVK